MNMGFSGDKEKKGTWREGLWEKEEKKVLKDVDKKKQSWWNRLWNRKK